MTKVEIPQLTGLRFMAAFSILFLHSVIWTSPFNDSNFAKGLANSIGVFGMPLFFVLSGFVIHYNYAALFRDQSLGAAARNFFSARFARIYPLFFFFLVFGSVTDFTSNWISYAPREFTNYVVHMVTLTQSWVYKLAIQDRMILDNGFGLSWSLSTEFFFYLAYPFLVFAILRIRRPAYGLAAAVGFAIFAIVVLYLALRNFDAIEALARDHLRDFKPDEKGKDNFYRWLFYYSPYARIFEFVLGCLTAQLFLIMRERPVARTERTWATVVFAVAMLWLIGYGAIMGLSIGLPGFFGPPGSFGAWLVGLVHVSHMNFGVAVPLAVVIFYTARYDGLAASFLALPTIVWLGEISYSIYVVHTWTIRPLIRPAISMNEIYAVDAILRVTIGILFTIFVAAGTYRLIEQPSRRYLRGLLMGNARAKPASYSTSP